MERLTSPNINVNPDTDRFLHAAIGGKEIDWKQCRDSTLNVLLNGPTSNGFGKDIFRKMVRDLYGRLKAYEDIAELCGGADRLRELAEADKDGRVVVLPTKPGAHVFVTGKRKIVECIVDSIYIDQRGPEAVMTFQCDSDCDGCPFYSPLPDPEGDFRCEGELEEAEIGFERFPAIAFPTREEAEKALEVMKDD